MEEALREEAVARNDTNVEVAYLRTEQAKKEVILKANEDELMQLRVELDNSRKEATAAINVRETEIERLCGQLEDVNYLLDRIEQRGSQQQKEMESEFRNLEAQMQTVLTERENAEDLAQRQQDKLLILESILQRLKLVNTDLEEESEEMMKRLQQESSRRQSESIELISLRASVDHFRAVVSELETRASTQSALLQEREEELANVRKELESIRRSEAATPSATIKEGNLDTTNGLHGDTTIVDLVSVVSRVESLLYSFETQPSSTTASVDDSQSSEESRGAFSYLIAGDLRDQRRMLERQTSLLERLLNNFDVSGEDGRTFDDSSLVQRREVTGRAPSALSSGGRIRRLGRNLRHGLQWLVGLESIEVK